MACVEFAIVLMDAVRVASQLVSRVCPCCVACALSTFTDVTLRLYATRRVLSPHPKAYNCGTVSATGWRDNLRTYARYVWRLDATDERWFAPTTPASAFSQ